MYSYITLIIFLATKIKFSLYLGGIRIIITNKRTNYFYANCTKGLCCTLWAAVAGHALTNTAIVVHAFLQSHYPYPNSKAKKQNVSLFTVEE